MGKVLSDRTGFAKVILILIGLSFTSSSLAGISCRTIASGNELISVCNTSASDIYLVIQQDCNLDGKTVIIPSHSVLSFAGGSIFNGEIDFNGCYIEGYAQISCGFTGKIANDYADLGWFGIEADDSWFDNGPIINEVASSFSNIHLPAGTYYFSTPIIMSNISHLDFLGDLKYRGEKNTTALTVSGWTAVVDFKGSVTCENNPNVNYTTGPKNSRIVGIDFVNINNSKIYVNSVSYFNENVKVSGNGYPGCCYNQFSFGIIRNANVGLRIYQNDNEGIGWANENTFIGGRFVNFPDWDSKNFESYAVMIKGGDNDNYNSCNSLYFLKQSFEGYKTIVYANNLQCSEFALARTEGSNLFVRFVGNCKRNKVSTSYQGECKLYDDEESTMLALDISNEPLFFVSSLSGQNSVTLDTQVAKLYKVKLSSPGRVLITYLSAVDTKTKSMEQIEMPLNSTYQGLFYYNNFHKAILNGGDVEEMEFEIPESVSSVKIQLLNDSQQADLFSVSQSATILPD